MIWRSPVTLPQGFDLCFLRLFKGNRLLLQEVPLKQLTVVALFIFRFLISTIKNSIYF